MINSTLDCFSELNINNNPLTLDQIKQIDELGYLIIDSQKKIFGFIGKDLNYLRSKVDQLLEDEGDFAGYEGREEHFKKGKRFEKIASRLGNLPNKDKSFLNFIMLPELLWTAYHVIKKDIMFSSSNFREPLKGTDQQQLHIDWLPRTNNSQNFDCVIAMMYLDDSKEINGAIKIIPGSHKILGYPDEYTNPHIDNSDTITVEAKAGSIIILNGNLWHRGGANINGDRRRIINAIYRDRNLKQGLNQDLYIDKKNKDKMNEAQKYMFKIRDYDVKQTEKIVGPSNEYREFLKKNPQFNYLGT